jgi:hypothetical protein
MSDYQFVYRQRTNARRFLECSLQELRPLDVAFRKT